MKGVALLTTSDKRGRDARLAAACCSARGLRADRHDKLLKLFDTGGQNCTPNNTWRTNRPSLGSSTACAMPGTIDRGHLATPRGPHRHHPTARMSERRSASRLQGVPDPRAGIDAGGTRGAGVTGAGPLRAVSLGAAGGGRPLRPRPYPGRRTTLRSLSAQCSTRRPVSAFRYGSWVAMTESPSAGRSTTSTGLRGSWRPAQFEALT